MRQLIGTLLIPLFACLFPSAAEAQANCSTTPTISLPLYPDDIGLLAVPISVGGQELRMELDSGARFHVLASSVVDALKLERRHVLGKAPTMFGGAPLSEYVTAKDVNLGGLRTDGLQMFVLPDSRLRGSDGFLASDLLVHFDVELDFVDGRVNLFPPCSGRGGYWPHKNAAVIVPFTTNSYNHIIVPVRLDGKSVNARVDTGASASVFDANAMEMTFGLTTASPSVGHIGGASDSTGWYRHTFDRLELGAITLPDVEVDFIPGSPGAAGHAELFIGSNILRNFHVYISYAERTLTLTEATGEPARVAATNAFLKAYLAAYHDKTVEAASLYSQAIATDSLPPSYRAAAYYERGLAYARLKQCSLANSDFMSAMRLDPLIVPSDQRRADAHHRLQVARKACPDPIVATPG